MSSVINLGNHRNYFLYRKETDMRKGFDSLCGIVLNELGRYQKRDNQLLSRNADVAKKALCNM